MSDFDKEAERERLREKYEQDEADREVTERMSELLLQGATMTNAHCRDCGNPIFRYDGQEFCPTCEKPVERGTETEEPPADAADGQADADEHIEVATPGDDARVRFGEDTPDEPASDTPRPSPDRRGATSDPDGRAPDPSSGAAADLDRTRAELHQRIRQLSQRAGACDNPRDAETLLAAAREAAEALAALRQ